MNRTAEPAITRFPLVGNGRHFSHGNGGHVWDDQGTEYVDFVCGMGPVVLGHANPVLNLRLSQALNRGVLFPGYSHRHESYLADLLSETPDYKAAFFKTASESVTACLRIAATSTGKLGLIRCGFIGWHDAQIGSSVRWHEPLESPHRSELRHTQFIRGIGANEPAYNWVDMRLESLRSLFECHGSQIGAFVFDAYLASFVPWQVIEEAVELCRQYGTLVIFDETKTGGRTSRLGVAHTNQLDVDLIVIGKALANGLPISLAIGSPDLIQIAEFHRLSGTFSKEVLAVEAAQATLDAMQTDGGYERLREVGAHVANTIDTACTDAGVDDLVKAKTLFGGSLFELSFDSSIVANLPAREALRICFAHSGVLLLQGHPSFVCLAHQNTNYAELKCKSVAALRAWKKELRGLVS